METLTGSDLVKHVQSSNPEASIEEVLDQTRTITLKRILVQIQKIPYKTAMDLLEDLCHMDLSLEDVRTLMEWYGGKAKLLSESRSFDTIYEFMSSKSKKTPCCWGW